MITILRRTVPLPLMALCLLVMLMLSFLKLCLSCAAKPATSSCKDPLHLGFHQDVTLAERSLDSMTRDLELQRFASRRVIALRERDLEMVVEEKPGKLPSNSPSRKRPMQGLAPTAFILTKTLIADHPYRSLKYSKEH